MDDYCNDIETCGEPSPTPLSLAPPETEVGALIRLAISAGQTPTELYAIYREERDRWAAKEFASSMARFQSVCPPVPRKSKADIVTGSGARYSYTFAELDEIARTVNPHLRDNGLSYTWDSKLTAGVLSCICTLRHANGHCVSASFSASTESRAGMSEMQKTAAALTFARRQSLVQVLGLTTCDYDIDGATGKSGEKISDEQVATLSSLITESRADVKRFLQFARVAQLSEILLSDYGRLVQALERKRAAQ